MSYRRYECPRQPKTPLDQAVTVVGAAIIAVTMAFVAIMAWCAL